MNIEFHPGKLTDTEQAIVTAGFRTHADALNAPDYVRQALKWLGFDDRNDLRAVLTADTLWDWLYVDELWVCPGVRGRGIGRRLMQLAEAFAVSRQLSGIWLWTQSWQAEGFYRQLGYSQFTRFDDFPKGHSRVGFRKQLAASGTPPADDNT